jgi:hypothetical protein
MGIGISKKEKQDEIFQGFVLLAAFLESTLRQNFYEQSKKQEFFVCLYVFI